MEQERETQSLPYGPPREPLRGGEEERKQLRISDILFAMKKRLLLIGVFTAAGLAAGIVLSLVSYMRGEMSKQYLITASIAVTAQSANGTFTTNSQNPEATDIYLAENMVDAVIYVIRSDRTLNAAVEKLDLIGVSTKDIYNNLHVNQYNETQIVELNLYWRSAQEGISILTAITQVVPDILISTLKIGSVSVINNPTSKYLIGGNLNASMWVYMAVLGAMLGMGMAVLELLIRPTLLNTRDVENQFGLELLGEIPERRAFFRKKRNLLLWSEDEDFDPAVTDNYAATAHILQKQFKKMNHPCVYVTSAAQNEGKTTVTAFLAVQLAELGMKVLLVDMDTRNPHLGGLFLGRVEYSHSLNALYKGDTDREEAVTQLTGMLDILPTVLERKTIPLDDAMCDLIRDLKNRYDVVLIDTAPVGQVADTMGLNRIADVALFVMRFDGASMGMIRESLQRIDKSGVPILGCIVNGVKTIRRSEREKYDGYYQKPREGGGRRRLNKKTDLERQWEEWERQSNDPVLAAARRDSLQEPDSKPDVEPDQAQSAALPQSGTKTHSAPPKGTASEQPGQNSPPQEEKYDE